MNYTHTYTAQKKATLRSIDFIKMKRYGAVMWKRQKEREREIHAVIFYEKRKLVKH